MSPQVAELIGALYQEIRLDLASAVMNDVSMPEVITANVRAEGSLLFAEVERVQVDAIERQLRHLPRSWPRRH